MNMYKLSIRTYGMFWSDCFSVSGTFNQYTMVKLLDACHAGVARVAELQTALYGTGEAAADWEARGGSCLIRIEAV